MANPFLNSDSRDVETAILLEQANVTDIGNAVAYTDGNRIFMNTEDNLFTILPAYDNKMLKWLLWHEKMHLELRHHNRFFKYLKELDAEKCKDEFRVTKEEVNIIMDILVHDSLARMFPDLVETAVNNLAQMRNRNSLKYTFTTNTLEDMLKEYADYKHKDEDEKGEGEGESEGTPEETDEEGDGTGEGKGDKPSDEESEGKSEARTTPEKDGHGASGKGKDAKEPEVTDETPEPEKESEQPSPEPEHDKTDWSKLDKIDSKEFIEKDEGDRYIEKIERLKRKKFRLSKLTQTLNGLATTTKVRSYRTPSTIQIGGGVILKGQTQGKTALYLCFDASGSMGREMETFKDIISKSIPQALDTPTVWFSGYCYRGSVENCKDPAGRNRDYYKGKFSDFMKVSADSGYNDDGDRTIEMCYKAEQMGYSPIGVTDGGGQLSWSKDMLKQLKRTVLVGQNRYWLEAAQKINPKVQILDI